MALVFKKTEINNDFSLINKLIYGFPKTGKTTLASHFVSRDGREPLFFTTEDGHGALEIFSQRLHSWKHFVAAEKNWIRYLESNVSDLRKSFSCIVIDLVSDLDFMCECYVCERENIKSLSDLDYGKGWKLFKDEFFSAINRLLAIMPVTFIAHSVEKTIQWENKEINVQTPLLSKSTLHYITGKSNVIGWIKPAQTKEDLPLLTFRPSLMAISGSQYSNIIKDFPMYLNDLGRTYKEIQDAFDGKTS